MDYQVGVGLEGWLLAPTRLFRHSSQALAELIAIPPDKMCRSGKSGLTSMIELYLFCNSRASLGQAHFIYSGLHDFMDYVS
jgi:hypothetical protein